MSLTRLAVAAVLLAAPARAQIDPTPRSLLQAGLNRPIDGRGPLAGYVYYYLNSPLRASRHMLRVAVAPVYVDSELGLRRALGPSSDLGIGLAGGGYNDSYAEMRAGRYLRGESFTGHGVKMSAAVYHDFACPGPAPLAGVLRGEARRSHYIKDKDTEPGFKLPPDQTEFGARAGLRWGGMEPLMLPKAAAEISVWYEGRFRTRAGPYGYAHDRIIEPHSHQFWSRVLAVYNLPRAQHRFIAQALGGTSRRADRFSAFRLGGVLPLAAEFPLSIPGYYYQEISAESFGILGGTYLLPISADRSTWVASLTGASAAVDYAPGVGQGTKSHTGVGAGINYTSESWQALAEYGYGINAARGHGNGSHTIGLRVQLDFRKTTAPMQLPRDVDRAIDKLLKK
ncbi:MAG: hypothetical protein HYZ74_07035 [Elusimicrobia bacterium]|nr:hypothetical protein [Elusimicrobiota bacterium]